jgi:hypothetical protein
MKVERPECHPPEIRVCILDIHYTEEISQLDRAVNLEVDGIEPLTCGIDVNGKSHEDCFYCPNATYDDLNRLYCKAEKTRELRQQRSNYTWLPSMLEYYWQNGIDEDGLAFLRSVGFVHLYA